MPPSPTRSGLAVAAVAALAVSSLALAPTPASGAVGGVTLLSQRTPDPRASTVYDGADSAIRLTAEQVDPAATISFEWNPDPTAGDAASGWVAVPGTPTVFGTGTGAVHTLNWDGAGAVGDTVAIRAVATVGEAVTYSTRPDVVVSDSTVPSVQIGPGYLPFGGGLDPNAATTGYFEQPYASTSRTATTMIVNGTTSAESGTVALAWWTGSGFAGTTAAAVEAANLKAPSPDNPAGMTVEGGRFATVLDIQAFDPEPDDVMTLSARLGSDDLLPTTLYPQTILAVDQQYDGDEVRAGESVEVPIYVGDAQSQPIAGVEVRRQSDDSLVGYTDITGYVQATQVGGDAEVYYANTTDSDPYEAGTDVLSDPVNVPTYVPEPTHAAPVSGDGVVWDVDEYRNGDLYVQVLDQEYRPLAAAGEVGYRLYASGADVPEFTTADVGPSGRLAVPFDPRQDGEDFRFDARLGTETPGSYQDIGFRKGDSRLRLTPAGDVRRAIGGQVDYEGSLEVAGTPLAGRRVTLTFRRGVEVVPGGAPDAGLLVDGRRVLTRTVVTDDDGEFEVTVDDADQRPRASEVGGRLTAATANRTASAPDRLDGNPAERAGSSPDFGTGERGTVRLTLAGGGTGARPDVLTVRGPDSVAGETVRVYRVAGRRYALVATRTLGRAGDVPRVVVADRNGAASTTYVVRLVPSERVRGSESARHGVR